MRYSLPIALMLFLIVCLYGCSEDKKVDLSAEEIIDNALLADNRRFPIMENSKVTMESTASGENSRNGPCWTEETK